MYMILMNLKIKIHKMIIPNNSTQTYEFLCQYPITISYYQSIYMHEHLNHENGSLHERQTYNLYVDQYKIESSK